MNEATALRVHAADDVAVMTSDAAEGATVRVSGSGEVRVLRAAGAVALGHKIALRALGVGDEVRKYGEVIGTMTAAAPPGAHVHIHNLSSLRAGRTPAPGATDATEKTISNGRKPL